MKMSKLFFKVLYTKRISILMYVVMFSLLFSLLIKNAQNKSKDVTAEHVALAVFDEDESELSIALKEYLLEVNDEVTLTNDKKVVQDALYNEDLDFALWIPKGFEESFLAETQTNEARTKLQSSVSLEERYSIALDSQISNFLASYELHLISLGEKNEENNSIAVKKAVETSTSDIVLKAASGEQGSSLQLYLAYLPFTNYIIIAVLFLAIGEPMEVIDDPKVRARDLSSGYPNAKRNLGLVFAASVSAIGIWLILVLISGIMHGFQVFTDTYILLGLLSNFIHMLSIAALVLLLNQLVRKKGSSSFFSTMLSVTLAFSSGIFIPRTIIWKPMLKFAAFFPTYWDVSNSIMLSEAYVTDLNYAVYWKQVFIMILMAAVYFLLSIFIRSLRMKEESI